MVWSEWVLLILVAIVVLVVISELFQGHKAKLPRHLKKHFGKSAIANLSIATRTFPYRVRADLQHCIDDLFQTQTVEYFSAITLPDGVPSITDCVQGTALPVSPTYEAVNTGGDEKVSVLTAGLWLFDFQGVKTALSLTPEGNAYCGWTGVRIEIATQESGRGDEISKEIFQKFEQTVQQSPNYRGKILSLEKSDYDFAGAAANIKVHALREVTRDDIVLATKTMDLLDRNVIRFVANRQRLAKLGQSTKKGLLFYGPPGTGKTHTLHYLANTLEEHTTLIVTAEQVGKLSEYMVLARLLQPCVIFIEDADLIARNRESMGVCEEVMLNKLLNEMDGLNEDAEILFILTTNRPEMLEEALASRPGRVDQAIEFALPNEQCRDKLVRMYGNGLQLPENVVGEIISRTTGVSAAFIKELMRRTTQFTLERDADGDVDMEDVHLALDEMLSSSGVLNLKILGYADGE